MVVLVPISRGIDQQVGLEVTWNSTIVKTVKHTITATTRCCGRRLSIDSEYVMTMVSEKAKALQGRTRKSIGMGMETRLLKSLSIKGLPSFARACFLLF